MGNAQVTCLDYQGAIEGDKKQSEYSENVGETSSRLKVSSESGKLEMPERTEKFCQKKYLKRTCNLTEVIFC